MGPVLASLLNPPFRLDHTVVAIFNNERSAAVATVNFSVPDDVKEAFNTTFSGQNKSAIITEYQRAGL